MILISQSRKVRKEFRKDLSVTLRLCEREMLITDIIKKTLSSLNKILPSIVLYTVLVIHFNFLK